MIKALLMAGFFTTVAGSYDTVWWRTQGAAVIGSAASSDCSLFFYDRQGGLILTWNRTSDLIAIENGGVTFTQSQLIPVAVQVGNTWIGDPADPSLTARGGGHLLLVTLVNDPLDKDLPDADHVTMKTQQMEMRWDINPAKLPPLLDAVAKCRRFLR